MKKITITLTHCLIIFLTSCSSESLIDRPKTPEELKAELKQLEQLSPITYISDTSVILTPKQKQVREAGFFRDAEFAPDGAIIEGDFISTATLAKYKDIQVTVSFYSQTETLIEEKSYILYEYLKPNSTLHFIFKLDSLPTAYKTFGFQVVGATVVE